MGSARKRTIEGTMSVREVVERYPETLAVFERRGLACVGCDAALFESLSQGAAVHGVPLDDLVKDLNEALRR